MREDTHIRLTLISGDENTLRVGGWPACEGQYPRGPLPSAQWVVGNDHGICLVISPQRRNNAQPQGLGIRLADVQPQNRTADEQIMFDDPDFVSELNDLNILMTPDRGIYLARVEGGKRWVKRNITRSLSMPVEEKKISTDGYHPDVVFATDRMGEISPGERERWQKNQKPVPE